MPILMLKTYTSKIWGNGVLSFRAAVGVSQMLADFMSYPKRHIIFAAPETKTN